MKTYKIWAGALSSIAISEHMAFTQPLMEDSSQRKVSKENIWNWVSHTKSSRIRFVKNQNEPYLVVEGFFCSANNTQEERQILDAALDFWNRQSGKFGYKIKFEGEEKIIPVFFQLYEASGVYAENGFFLPAGRINSNLLTYLEVVPDKRMKRLDKSLLGGHAIGFAAPNTIYISDKYADIKSVGYHEMGHVLGAKHVSHSVMDATISQVKPKVKKKTICQILARGGVPVKGLKRMAKSSRGLFKGNFKGGKIVKHKQKVSQPYLAYTP